MEMKIFYLIVEMLIIPTVREEFKSTMKLWPLLIKSKQ